MHCCPRTTAHDRFHTPFLALHGHTCTTLRPQWACAGLCQMSVHHWSLIIFVLGLIY